jgi:membrane fusion protein (multidrug efflux system)
MVEKTTMHYTSRMAPRVILVASCIFILISCGGSEPPAPPPLEIPVIELVSQNVPIYLDMVGQTRGSVDIPIRARVEGFLESMDFIEGRNVEKGALLYTIDARPFEAKVAEAMGRLAEARTARVKAKADLDRIRPLAEMKAVSEQDLDSAVAQYEAAIGGVQAADAQLEQANIELSYCTITAPIDGLIGITAAEVGEFVGAPPNPVVLNYVSKIDPIRVRFSINEQEYLRFARTVGDQMRGESLKNADNPDRALKLILADGQIHPFDGRVTALDASINPTTGTLTLEADFPNPNRIILAGQFARVRAIIDRRENAIMVPQRAVNETQGKFQAFVVDAQGNVEMRLIEVGPVIDHHWLVESGLEAGERIAIEGLQRLRDGITVNPQLVDPDAPAENPDSGAF